MAIKSETRDVSNFDEVFLQGMGDLFLQQGDHDSLVIEADEALLERLKSEVHGSRLELGIRHWWDAILPPLGPVRYHITMRAVKGVHISGSGTLACPFIQSDHLELEVSGSGQMDIDRLDVNSLELAVSGAGRVDLSAGRAAEQIIRISGSGSLKASELEGQIVSILISGSGQVSVNAQEKLDVQISGMGTVRYLGQPKVSQSISGAGRVEQMR